MKEDESNEQVRGPQADAVDMLEDFVQSRCEIAIGREFQTVKSEFQSMFGGFCKEKGIEPPSNGLLGTLLVNLFPPIWSDFVELKGEKTPVWRNLTLKEMPATKSKEAR